MSFTPFNQIPYYDDNETFIMTAPQLRALSAMCEHYSTFIQSMETFFAEQMNIGKIKVKYEDLSGNPLTKEQIDEMLSQYAQELASNIENPN